MRARARRARDIGIGVGPEKILKASRDRLAAIAAACALVASCHPLRAITNEPTGLLAITLPATDSAIREALLDGCETE